MIINLIYLLVEITYVKLELTVFTKISQTKLSVQHVKKIISIAPKIKLKLPKINNVDSILYEKLRAIYKDFSLDDAEKVKHIEKITNHDVKSVDY